MSEAGFPIEEPRDEKDLDRRLTLRRKYLEYLKQELEILRVKAQIIDTKKLLEQKEKKA